MHSKSAAMRIVFFALSSILLVSGGIWTTGAAQLHLRSGVVDLPSLIPADGRPVLERILDAGLQHAVVQFDRPVDDAVRAQVAAAGVTLLGYLGDNSFFAYLSSTEVDLDAIARVGSLVAAGPIQPNWKVHPLLVGGTAPPYAVVSRDPLAGDIIGTYILFHRDVSIGNEAPAIVARHSAQVRDILESVNGLVIELPAAAVAPLAAEDDVMWIEPALPRMSTTNNENRVITQANNAQAAPYNLTGNGVTVLAYDAGTAQATHQDFGGRLFVRDGSGVIDHSTHVSGTVGGNGVVSGGVQRGMAPGVTIQSYGFQWDGSGLFLYTNPGDIEADYTEAINTFGADIANNSIGTNVESNGFACSIQGDYGVTDALIDGIVRGSLGGGPFRIVWAQGNERQGNRCNVEGFGSYYSTSPPATAKNHITVGALNTNDDSMTSFSSWGPTDDGRMKPDVTAPGCQSGGDNGVTSCSRAGGYLVFCGTSMSSPTVTGCCALLLEDFRAHFPSQPDPRNSTLKILLAHNAVDWGNTGPDYQFGYGSIRIKDTVDFMRLGNFTEDEVSQGMTVEYTAQVSPGTPVFKAMLAWDDPSAVPNAAVALVNDLDLVAIDPSNGTHFPWTLSPQNPSTPATRSANHRDNIEQVLVNNPAPGTWHIRVIGFNVPEGPQPFSMCATAIDQTTGVGETGSAAAETRSMLRVRPNPFTDELAVEFELEAGGAATVSIYSPAGRRVRQLIASNLRPGPQQVLWDGRDEEHRAVPHGIYFVELRAEGMVSRQKVMVMRDN